LHLLLKHWRATDVKLLLKADEKCHGFSVLWFVLVLPFSHKGLFSQVLALWEVQNGQLQLTALFGNTSNYVKLS